MTQTLAAQPAAASFASRYAQYQPSQGYNAKPFHKLFVLCVSLPKTGKSTFIESNPNLLRIDFDRAGTSNPKTQCMTVPTLQQANGKPVIIDKAWLDGLILQLVNDARTNQPRPETICFDTIDKMMEVLCYARAAELKVKSFSDLDAKEWGTIYNWIADYCNVLVQHGYGLWLCSHIVNKKIEISDRQQMMLDLTLRDTLFTRMRGGLDLIVAVDRTVVTTTTPIPKKHPVTKEVIPNSIERIETTNEEVVEMLFNPGKPTNAFDPDFSRLVCKRIGGLPDRIRLPRVGAWEVVRTAYEQAATTDGATLLA